MTDKPADGSSLIADLQRMMDAHMPPLGHMIISERAAKILLSQGIGLTRKGATILLPDGTDLNGDWTPKDEPEERRHFETPKPLGKRAKRRSRGKKS